MAPDKIDDAMRAGMRHLFAPTPLPWKLAPRRGYVNEWIITNERGESIADFSPGSPGITPEAATGNVRFVLLAVSLHAELVGALGALGVIGDGYCFCSAARDPDKTVHEPECRDARAVLAKVTY